MKIEKSHPVYAELVAGVRELMQKTTPARFLIFLADCMHYMHFAVLNTSKKDARQEDEFYTINVIIEKMLLPWFAGGPDVVDEVANGFAELLCYCGAEDICVLNNEIIAAFGLYTQEMIWSSTEQQRHLEGMGVLLGLLQHAEAAELAMESPSLAVA